MNCYATTATMWPIDEIELRDIQFDFTSSGGGRPRTHGVYASGICLVNALAYAELNDDPTQLLVCEQCGTVRCNSGGWVRIRRIATSIAFIPAFAEMLAGDFECNEFSPPEYVYSRGAPLFSSLVYERLRTDIPAFPSIEGIKSITPDEAVRLLQWHAPLQILGRFPHRPQLNRDLVLAVSDGQLDDECNHLQRLLDANLDASFDISDVGASTTVPVEFHLDGPGFPVWRPLAHVGDMVAFNLEPAGCLLPEVRTT